MEWTEPFAIFRIDETSMLTGVYDAPDVKKAKYILTYVAEPGDVLCRTPAHPKNESETPSYYCHKQDSGTIITDKEGWLEMLKAKNCSPEKFQRAESEQVEERV